MNSILIPESLLHDQDYNAKKYFEERFPSDYSTMESNPNYSESGCGIAVTASETENTLSIKDPNDDSKELCKLTYSNSGLKFTYKKPAMVNNITMVGVGSDEKLNILEDNFDILHLNVVKKMGGVYDTNATGVYSSVCYGNGKFVAVAQTSNVFAYSTDGITWTQGNMPSEQEWISVCYGNGKFVAVAQTSNVFAYSTDGINWTEGTMPSSKNWSSVCYGNGKFVAIVYGSNVFAYSTDGINWTEGTMPSSKNWSSVCYGNNKFVAVSGNSGIFAYSTDGITWTEGNMPSIYYWISVCYGNGKFVAVAQASNVFAYSTDGITWTQGNMPSSQYWCSVCYGNGKFVAIAWGSDVFTYSYNGYIWYDVTMDSSHDLYSICYSPDHNFYVAVGDGISIFSIPDAYSGGVCSTFAVKYSWSGSIPDGVTLPNPTSYASGANVTIDTTYTSDSIVQELGEWTQGTMPSSQRWYSVCYGNGKFVAVANNSSVFAYSSDGINWTQGTMPSDDKWEKVCYGNGKFVAIIWESNVFAYSTDGINWTEGTILSSSKYWRSVCYGNDKFVAISYASSSFAYSSDGINWTQGNMPSSASWQDVCYGNGMFVAIVINSNIFAYSSDGINWTEGTMPSSQVWRSVCYGNDKFVAISSASSSFAYSSDGINWTQGSLSNNYIGYSICYGNGEYVITSVNNNFINVFAYSSDGINWTQGNMPSKQHWYSVCYGNGKYVVITFNAISSAYLTLPDSYYSFSGWSQTGTFNITSDTSITGYWSQKNKLSVTYSWTNAPTGMTSTVPAKVTGLMPNETVAVDTTYSSKTAYKNTSEKKYYKFSGWNKSGEFNITSNTSISGSWDNGTASGTMALRSFSTTGPNWFRSACNDTTVVIISDAGYYATYNGTGDISRTASWTQGTFTKGTNGWQALAYGSGKFVALNTNKYYAYSSDGITWNYGNFTYTEGTVMNLCYGNGKFVAPLFSSKYCIYSSDGITWNETTIGTNTSEQWDCVCYGNGLFIALSSWHDYAAYSSDGITWVINTLTSSTSAGWISVAYGDGRFIGISVYQRYCISTDGKNWTIGSLPLNKTWYSITYGEGKFIVTTGSNAMTTNCENFLVYENNVWSTETFGTTLYGMAKTVYYKTYFILPLQMGSAASSGGVYILNYYPEYDYVD